MTMTPDKSKAPKAKTPPKPQRKPAAQALLKTDAAKADAKPMKKGETVFLPVSPKWDKETGLWADGLHKNPWQPRTDFGAKAELAESIKAGGQSQPIVVRPHPERPGEWQIADGETRVEAIRLLHIREPKEPTTPQAVEAVVRDLSDAEMMLYPWRSNQERKSLNELEEAQYLKRMVDETSYRKVAEALGRSLGYIQHKVAVFNYQPEIVESFIHFFKNGFSASHAEALHQLVGTELHDIGRKTLLEETRELVILDKRRKSTGDEKIKLSVADVRERRSMIEDIIKAKHLSDEAKVSLIENVALGKTTKEMLAEELRISKLDAKKAEAERTDVNTPAERPETDADTPVRSLQLREVAKLWDSFNEEQRLEWLRLGYQLRGDAPKPAEDAE